MNENKLKNNIQNLGFLNVACAVPKVHLADVKANTQEIIRFVERAESEQISVLLFPELCTTGYSIQDLFFSRTILEEDKQALLEIAAASSGKKVLICLGSLIEHRGRLYNCAVMIQNGKILGAVPKIYLPENREFYEKRWFSTGEAVQEEIVLDEQRFPLDAKLLFGDRTHPDWLIGAEICEDLWAPKQPSQDLALAGAAMILNPSASNELIGKAAYRESLIRQQSARLDCVYLYASAGFGESTTDVYYGGDAMIAENGQILARSKRFSLENQLIKTQIDFDKLLHDRMMQASFKDERAEGYQLVPVSLVCADTIFRYVNPRPFVPADENMRSLRCEEISNIQAGALASRLSHIGKAPMVIGISGGLDSTLALLVSVRAADLIGMERSQIHAVTMPGFGTTDRTYQNAVELIKNLGVSFHEIPIADACLMHFDAIGHDPKNHNHVYENTQARERTQILMDLANAYNGIVVGTGDLSELALGWATYNGDHMSMYGVNASIPKTLVRYLVGWYAQEADETLRKLLEDILDTPVSPELLPPDEDGKISQKTEDLVGPYDLHDFFLYYFMRFGYTPEKIFYLACQAFDEDPKIIAKWLDTFFRRFFSQQFKRSCMPDGPKVGSVSLSPRGDLRMPSDAKSSLYLKQTKEILEEYSCI